MGRHLWLLLALELCSLCACFRELGDVQQKNGPLPELTLEVRDRNDALWDAENAPRVPLLFLRADDGSRLELGPRLFLLRGAPSDDLIDDLRSKTLRAATEMARVELIVEDSARAQGEASASPRTPLEPGARYTLVWATPAGSLQFPLTISRSPAAGARLVESLPGELSGRVPTNISRFLLRFDGYLATNGAALELLDAQGQPVASRSTLCPCKRLGLPEGDCIELTPSAALAEASRHTLRLGPGLTDLTGAPLAARDISFTTLPERDLRAPSLRGLDCAKDERVVSTLCVLAREQSVALRARSDESGYLSLSAGGTLSAAIGASSDYSLELPLTSQGEVTFALSDLAGNTTHGRVTLAPAPDLARVSIDEVRVDPLGPEPAQEYVELLNFGASNVSMMGFSLTHDPYAQGQAITGEVTLLPGERVLVVPPDFDLADAADGVLPAGVRVARLARPLSLRNEGTTLYLRDGRGARLSAAPAVSPDKPGQCIYRVGDDPRSGDVRAFARDAHGACTPGAASTP